jgi:hypothetical protein
MRSQLRFALGSLFISGSAFGLNQTLPIPNQDWEIVIDAPALGARQDAFERGQYRLSGGAGELNLSLFVETPATKGEGHEPCREYYWSRGSRNPAIDKTTIRLSSHERYERVEYVTQRAAAGDRSLRHVNYFFAHGGKWMDVHISGSNDSSAVKELISRFDRGLLYRDSLPSPERAPAGMIERVVCLSARNPAAVMAPAGWRSAVVWPPNDVPPTLKFIPERGDDFDFKLTLAYRMDGKVAPPSDDQVRAVADSALAKIQPSAASRLELRPWENAGVRGVYFFATDKSPKSGEYPYLLQGAARMDELLLSYTVLMRRNTPEAVAQMLAVLKSLHRHAAAAR